MGDITYIYIKNPEKSLVAYLGANFSFNKDSMLADFSKLYSETNKKVRFDIIIAIKNNKIIAYGMVSDNLAKNRRCFNYKDVFGLNSLLLMLYVKSGSRKLGIASEFFKRLSRETKGKTLNVISHDSASLGFFNKMQSKYKKINIIDWI